MTGEVFVVARNDAGMDAAQLVRAIEGATKALERLDWRLHGIVVVPVGALEAGIPPRVGETSGAER